MTTLECLKSTNHKQKQQVHLTTVRNFGLGTVLDFDISENFGHLTRTPEGDLRDGLPNRDRLGAVRTPSGKIDIMLDLVQRPNEPSIWLFRPRRLGTFLKYSKNSTNHSSQSCVCRHGATNKYFRFHFGNGSRSFLA